jgi:hypothetical protein
MSMMLQLQDSGGGCERVLCRQCEGAETMQLAGKSAARRSNLQVKPHNLTAHGAQSRLDWPPSLSPTVARRSQGPIGRIAPTVT